MLNVSTFPQTTDMNKIIRRNFLGFLALAVLNFTLLNNLLIHSQPNAEALWAYLWTLIETASLVSVFADCQRTITFQISSDQDFASQITEFDFLCIRLYRNNCNIPLFLQIDDLLNFLTQSTQKNFVVSKKINYTCIALS